MLQRRDVDNYHKTLLDAALNKYLGIDDSFVYDLVLSKRLIPFGEVPRVLLSVSVFHENEGISKYVDAHFAHASPTNINDDERAGTSLATY
jgi:hypothetical protein